MPGHNFNAHATIIEGVYNKSLSKLKIRSLLEHKESFWILKLQTLSPQGLKYHLIILKALLDLFGGHFKTRFHALFCSFHTLSNLIAWMSYAKFIDVRYNIINNTYLINNTYIHISNTTEGRTISTERTLQL